MVIFPLLSFAMAGWMMGWASAPYDREWAYRHPRRAAAMALAGPAANFTLAIVAGLLIRIGLLAGVFSPPDFLRFSQVAIGAEGVLEALAVIVSILFSLNVLLGVFNLLPVPPLDGWSALGLILPESGARKLGELSARFGMFTVLGLLIAWQSFGYIYTPIFRFAVRAVYGLFG
jgi:Zn-dependent protease